VAINPSSPGDVHRTARNGSPGETVWTAENLGRERALRAAVLIDAIRCLVGPAAMRDRPTRQSAQRWIRSRDSKGAFSFSNVCDALGLDPSRLRRSLLDPAFGADGLSPALGEVRPAEKSGHMRIRRPLRDRSRYIIGDGAP
jgi:hypothetical protein